MITLKAFDINKTQKLFNGIVNRMNDPRQAMNLVAMKAWKDVQDHFAKESGPAGKWAPLADSTLAQRRQGKKKRSSKILQDTGNLRNRILFRNTGKDAEVATSVVYAARHNYGYKQTPQRKFLWLSKTALTSILNTLKKYIISGQ